MLRTLARVATRRPADLPAERAAEGARRAVTDAFGDLAKPHSYAPEVAVRSLSVVRMSMVDVNVP